MAHNNDENKIKRIVKTGENTYYADTKKKGSILDKKPSVPDQDINLDDLIRNGDSVDDITAKLDKLIGKPKEQFVDKNKITDIRSNIQNAKTLEKYDDKSVKLEALEQSLINFLERKKDIENLIPGGVRRIRALSMSIDLKNTSKPYFKIQIGVCEASFDAETGLKEKGSCFGVERFVRDWYSVASVKEAMKKVIEEKIQQTLKEKDKR